MSNVFTVNPFANYVSSMRILGECCQCNVSILSYIGYGKAEKDVSSKFIGLRIVRRTYEK